ncbi:MAG: type II and III secretion system protein family protein [Deltaproteobacteria bacterium]|nr:type II and III secretion system protein family protein [Deltaproteobacteria bacterium]
MNLPACMLLALLMTIPGGIVHAANCSDFASTGCKVVIAPHMSFVKSTTAPITRIAVADPTLADAELLTPTQVLIVAQEKLGTTSLILWHGDSQADVYEIEVRLQEKVWNEIRDALRRLVPDARVKVERVGDGVVLDGTVESQRDLERVLEIVKGLTPNFTNLLSVRGSQQIQLEVKIAEVSRSGIKEIGLGFLLDKDWKVAVFPAGTAAGSLNAVRERGAETSTSNTDTILSSLGSAAILSSPYSSAFQVLAHGVEDDLLGLISLLKGQGLSRLLASPTLVTMSGQQAQFLVGGEYPYPVTDENGNVNIQFKQFGILLRFTPYLVGDETITLAVEPEVSALDYSVLAISGGTGVPGLTTRRGQTTLQLKDGQTFAMAGLLKEETRSAVSKIPLLGDIPVLGALFTSKEFQNNETELIIVVKPRIVRALNPQEVPSLPGETMAREVTDLDFFLLNRAEPRQAAHGNGKTVRVPRFIGQIGFTR